jgi:hypothetical protein
MRSKLFRRAAAILAVVCAFGIVTPAVADDCSCICGEIIIRDLITPHGDVVGAIAVGNSDENLFIQFMAYDSLLLTKTDIALIRDLEAFPFVWEPIDGNIFAQVEHDPPVEIYRFTANLEALGLEPGEHVCMAGRAMLAEPPSGEVITAYASGEILNRCPFIPIFCFNIQECEEEDCQLRTQTQGGWGAPAAGNNPGTYRDANFDAAFPAGVTIGCGDGFEATFTSAAAVQAFLPAGGSPGALDQDLTDPTSTSGGVLAGQVLALSLSVGFDLYDADFGECDTALAEMVVADEGSACHGMTVLEVLSEANAVLGGCESEFSASEINDCVTAINENYVDGDSDNGFLALP